MYRISKKFRFDAAHRLDGLPMGHKCGRMHGHTYEVEVFLESAGLNSVGFVRDYGELAPFKEWLMDTFDHRLINETVPQSTAENMAHIIYNRAVAMFQEVVAVRVSETDNTTAWYSPHSLPPLDTVLDVFESLAAESGTSTDKARLMTAISSILSSAYIIRGGGGSYGPGATGGNSGADDSVYYGVRGPQS